MVAKLRCFCYCVPFSTCFPSFQPSLLKLVFPQFHAFYVYFPHVQVKQRHTFDTFLSVRVLSIESTLCKFFSRLCTLKRIQKKWKGLIWSRKGWSKNKPTCKNAVSQTLYGSCTLRVMGSWCKTFPFITEGQTSYTFFPWPTNKMYTTSHHLLFFQSRLYDTVQRMQRSIYRRD